MTGILMFNERSWWLAVMIVNSCSNHFNELSASLPLKTAVIEFYTWV
jgi:hypothetical protein